MEHEKGIVPSSLGVNSMVLTPTFKNSCILNLGINRTPAHDLTSLAVTINFTGTPFFIVKVFGV